ncbi:hypothetical protein BSLG_006317 [Batrachochytrium salamandrivorans]|nr:hypothetical protein BSLG_006317 [Batrachochytrium salamandrivorans]
MSLTGRLGVIDSSKHQKLTPSLILKSERISDLKLHRISRTADRNGREASFLSSRSVSSSKNNSTWTSNVIVPASHAQMAFNDSQTTIPTDEKWEPASIDRDGLDCAYTGMYPRSNNPNDSTTPSPSLLLNPAHLNSDAFHSDLVPVRLSCVNGISILPRNIPTKRLISVNSKTPIQEDSSEYGSPSQSDLSQTISQSNTTQSHLQSKAMMDSKRISASLGDNQSKSSAVMSRRASLTTVEDILTDSKIQMRTHHHNVDGQRAIATQTDDHVTELTVLREMLLALKNDLGAAEKCIEATQRHHIRNATNELYGQIGSQLIGIRIPFQSALHHVRHQCQQQLNDVLVKAQKDNEMYTDRLLLEVTDKYTKIRVPLEALAEETTADLRKMDEEIQRLRVKSSDLDSALIRYGLLNDDEVRIAEVERVWSKNLMCSYQSEIANRDEIIRAACSKISGLNHTHDEGKHSTEATQSLSKTAKNQVFPSCSENHRFSNSIINPIEPTDPASVKIINELHESNNLSIVSLLDKSKKDSTPHHHATRKNSENPLSKQLIEMYELRIKDLMASQSDEISKIMHERTLIESRWKTKINSVKEFTNDSRILKVLHRQERLLCLAQQHHKLRRHHNVETTAYVSGKTLSVIQEELRTAKFALKMDFVNKSHFSDIQEDTKMTLKTTMEHEKEDLYKKKSHNHDNIEKKILPLCVMERNSYTKAFTPSDDVRSNGICRRPSSISRALISGPENDLKELSETFNAEYNGTNILPSSIRHSGRYTFDIESLSTNGDEHKIVCSSATKRSPLTSSLHGENSTKSFQLDNAKLQACHSPSNLGLKCMPSAEIATKRLPSNRDVKNRSKPPIGLFAMELSLHNTPIHTISTGHQLDMKKTLLSKTQSPDADNHPSYFLSAPSLPLSVSSISESVAIKQVNTTAMLSSRPRSAQLITKTKPTSKAKIV